MFLSWQLTFLFKSTVKCVAVDLTTLPLLTKGQMGQLLQGTIPGVSLLGLKGALGGTLLLIKGECLS